MPYLKACNVHMRQVRQCHHLAHTANSNEADPPPLVRQATAAISEHDVLVAETTVSTLPWVTRFPGAASLWLIVCCRLLRFEFFNRSVQVRRSVMNPADRFNVAAVAEGATLV